MIKVLAATILVFAVGLLQAQQDINQLRTQFNQQYDSGHFNQALVKADAIIAYWETNNAKDSANFYRYRHAHTLGVSGRADESVLESGKLVDKLEANPPLPSFMGGLYFTAGSNLLYLSEFAKATDLLNKSIDFESSQSYPDTLTLAKSYEWKGIVSLYTDELEQAQNLVELALELRYAIYDSTEKPIAYNLNSLASVYDTRGLKPQAAKAYEEAYRILRLHLPPDHPQLMSVASNLSIVKSDLGEIDAAMELLEEAIAIHEEQNAVFELIIEYNNLGGIYTGSLQDNKRGRIYFNRSLHLADSLLPVPHISRANLYDGIGATYYNESNYMKADSFFLLAFQEREKVKDISASELGQSSYNLALTADETGDLSRARKYYTKSLDYRMEAYGENHPKTANSIFGLGNIDWQDGKNEEALKKYRRSLQIYSSNLSNLNTWPLENMVKLADCFNQLNQADSSDYYLKKAWEGVCDTEGQPIDMDKLSEYPLLFVDPFVLDIIDFNLDLLIQQKELIGDPDNQADIELMKTMDNLMVELWPLLNFDNETSPLLPKIKTIYRKGVFLASLNETDDYKVKTLFLNSLEQSRSASIRSALQNRNAMHFAHVPDSVVERDRMLRDQLRYVQAKAKSEQDEYWEKLRFDTFNNWRSYQKQLQSEYPEWYQARYAPSIPSLDELQASLKQSKSTLVAYFVADTSAVVLIGDANNFNSLILPLPEAWRDSVRTFRLLTENRADPKRLASLSYYLYTLFWKPIEDKVGNRIMLIPDGVLNFLNFETLVSTMPKTATYAEWDWLLKKHIFLIRSSLPGKDKPPKEQATEILALSPGFSDELKANYRSQLGKAQTPDSTFTHWVQTPWSVEFTEGLRSKGKSYVGIEATKAAFRENAVHAGILHFGTHAQLNDSKPLNSYLALTPQPQDSDDGYLYAYELYDQPLNAQLAVLTACQTGVGEYREGDGVISLAHAFQYAGCPNVVYSLWQIDDKQSTWVMKQFYSHLDEDLSFSESLRQAKLDYLASHTEELNAPYYWGGVVLTGEDGKMTIKESLFGRFWWLFLFLIPIILVATRSKRNARKQKLSPHA